MTLPPNLTADRKRALAFKDVVASSKVRGFQLVMTPSLLLIRHRYQSTSSPHVGRFWTSALSLFLTIFRIGAPSSCTVHASTE